MTEPASWQIVLRLGWDIHLGNILPTQLVKAAEKPEWVDEDSEEIRHLDFGEGSQGRESVITRGILGYQAQLAVRLGQGKHSR